MAVNNNFFILIEFMILSPSKADEQISVAFNREGDVDLRMAVRWIESFFNRQSKIINLSCFLQLFLMLRNQLLLHIGRHGLIFNKLARVLGSALRDGAERGAILI